jgi:hypothetical protein
LEPDQAELTAMRRLLALLAATSLAVLISACAQPTPLYRWGEYEPLVYDMYMRPGKADPATQIAKLNEDIERTNAEGLHVAPGVHAHLGYLYYGQGQLDAAYEQFTLEKTLFPESTVFIDGVLGRMKKQ